MRAQKKTFRRRRPRLYCTHTRTHTRGRLKGRRADIREYGKRGCRNSAPEERVTGGPPVAEKR